VAIAGDHRCATKEDRHMSAASLGTPQSGAIGTFVKAIVGGTVVAFAGLGIWGALLAIGIRFPSLSIWLVPVMAVVLFGGGVYLKYGAWPRTGFAFRSEAVRLNAVRLRPFLLALAAGWSTMAAGFCLYVARRSMLGLGGEDALVLPHAPLALLLPGLAMAGIVAGVVEEIAFRGFMQGTLERRFGVVPAVLVSGFVWALFHLNHSYFGEAVFLWFVIFLAVATMLGTIAHRTNSVVPGIAVHSGFDIAYFVAAGLLAPRIAPIAFLEQIASPSVLIAAAVVFAGIAFLSWLAFLRATRD
jgi:membrane protease YdiL (CAAX protease family)